MSKIVLLSAVIENTYYSFGLAVSNICLTTGTKFKKNKKKKLNCREVLAKVAEIAAFVLASVKLARLL